MATTDTSCPSYPVLDPAQLRRIESAHRGFLYQHLYATSCLFAAAGASVVAVDVERDEDVELVLADRHAYVQVKTRGESLQQSEVSDVLDRAELLRREHLAGTRSGTPEFWVVSNVAPGPKLLEAIGSPTWPSDVRVLWPGSTVVVPPYLVPPVASLDEAVRACASAAAALPFCRLSPETLTWKTAALVQHAAAGAATTGGPHRFRVADLPALFEQVVLQLQRFPAPPERYWSQDPEPDYASGSRVRVLVGFSGAGKTMWAATASLHQHTAAVYYDVAGLAGAALPAVLTREVAGHLLSSAGADLGTVLMPGLAALDGLRAVDAALSRRGLQCVIFLDNVHRLDPDDVLAAATAAGSLRWVLLAQPHPTLQALCGRLGVEPERLGGWSADTLAAVFRAAGAPVTVSSVGRLRRITGGLPLHAQNAARLAREVYGGNADRLCDELEALAHVAPTTQEVILRQVRDALSAGGPESLAVLTTSEVPLTPEETRTVIEQSRGVTASAAASAIRELTSWGVLQTALGRELALHDAFRLAAADDVAALHPDRLLRARQAVHGVLRTSILEGGTHARRRAYLRLLPQVGELTTLLELAAGEGEALAEQGYAPDLIQVITEASESPSVPPELKFWTHDTLAAWHYQRGELDALAARVVSMGGLVDGGSVTGAPERTALSLKRMLLHGRRGEVDDAKRCFADACGLNEGGAEVLRVARYNFGLSLHLAGRHEEAEEITVPLIAEYYAVLGLKPEHTIGKNPDQIWPHIKDKENAGDDLKRLADSLDLRAATLVARGLHPVLSRLHAHKFYVMADAYTSAIRAGQDVVDELVGIEDFTGARIFMERTLLPNIAGLKLLDYVTPVRGQYAVVLARCGELAKARAEMARLREFDIRVEREREELDLQETLIEVLAEQGPRWGLRPLARRSPAAMLPKSPAKPSVCRCGSGKKARNCCDRRHRR